MTYNLRPIILIANPLFRIPFSAVLIRYLINHYEFETPAAYAFLHLLDVHVDKLWETG